jgi:hypothetical protein
MKKATVRVPWTLSFLSLASAQQIFRKWRKNGKILAKWKEWKNRNMLALLVATTPDVSQKS